MIQRNNYSKHITAYTYIAPTVPGSICPWEHK